MTRAERSILALLAAGALVLQGRALLPLSGEQDDREPDVEVRPNAPPEYDVLVAQQHLSEGRMTQALAAYERAAAKDPDSAYLHRMLADALARSNRLEKALVHARRAYELYLRRTERATSPMSIDLRARAARRLAEINAP